MPVATLTTLTLQEDTTKVATLTATDADSNDTFTFSMVAQPQHGTLSLDSNGTFSYTPNPNFNGRDSFSYRVNDGTTDSVEQSVDIEVTAVNDAIVPTFTRLIAQEDSNTTATLTATNVDNNSSILTFSIVVMPQHGTISLDSNGSFIYTPNPNFSGSDSFAYKVSDGVDDSVEQNVTITVININDKAVATPTTLTLQEDTTKVATLRAIDVDGDTLTFRVVTQPQHGTLNLEANGSFSYTPNSNFNGSDSFTYRVNDGNYSVEQNVTITVTAINDAPQIDTEFKNISIGDSATKRLDINISDMDGDSLTLNIESNNSIVTIGKNFTNPISQADYTDKALDFNFTTAYKIGGSATVTITLSDGDTNVSKSFVVNIVYNHGDELRTLITACNNSNSSDSDECKRVSDYNTSGITDMSHMFDGIQYNIDVSKWDTSNVTDMSYMFSYNYGFNQPLNSWDTSKVTNMSVMFYYANRFNQPLNDWNVSQVTDMSDMFNHAISFNQPLNSWDTSKVTTMRLMFFEATNFNQPLNSWDTSKVAEMFAMFYYASSFNQPLNYWNVSQVTDMSEMFKHATNFNQPLNSWDTSKVTKMRSMFFEATNFNQPLNNWNVSSVRDHVEFSKNSGLSQSNLPKFNP